MQYCICKACALTYTLLRFHIVWYRSTSPNVVQTHTGKCYRRSTKAKNMYVKLSELLHDEALKGTGRDLRGIPRLGLYKLLNGLRHIFQSHSAVGVEPDTNCRQGVLHHPCLLRVLLEMGSAGYAHLLIAAEHCDLSGLRIFCVSFIYKDR